MTVRQQQLKDGLWLAYEANTPLGFLQAIPRSSLRDGDTSDGGLAGLLPGSNIGDTKTWSVTNNYYFSNYPEKGHGPGLDGQILWRTEEAVTGNVAIGFNHKNIGTSGATLKLLVSPAPTSNRPSVGWAELFSMCDAEASSLAMGRLVIEEDERARISSNLPTIAVGGSGVWASTVVPMAKLNGSLVSSIETGQVVTGLINLTISGSVFLGLSIWPPSSFPSIVETPADQLMRSRRRGRVEAKQMAFTLSKTSFNWISDPAVQGMGDGDAHFWTSFVGMGSPPNLDWDTTTTPNETWMVIAKVEMPNGDNEHWGDYMVKVSCSPITLTM